MMECLEVHQSRGENEEACTKHLYRLDKVKGDVLTCGKKARCLDVSGNDSVFMHRRSWKVGKKVRKLTGVVKNPHVIELYETLW